MLLLSTMFFNPGAQLCPEQDSSTADYLLHQVKGNTFLIDEQAHCLEPHGNANRGVLVLGTQSAKLSCGKALRQGKNEPKRVSELSIL